MLVSFGIKFIRQDQKQLRNGETCQAVFENTILVTFDIRFIGRDHKQHRNGTAC